LRPRSREKKEKKKKLWVEALRGAAGRPRTSDLLTHGQAGRSLSRDRLSFIARLECGSDTLRRNRRMTATPRWVVLLCFGLVLLPLLASAQDRTTQAAVGELGRGTVTLQTKQGATDLVIVLGTDLPGLVALRVQVLNAADDLVRVTAKNGERALGTERSRAAKATLTSSADEVSGPYQIAMVEDLSNAPGLVVTAYRADGRAYPFSIQGMRGSAKVEFKLNGTNCVETTSTCGPPTSCTVTASCCGPGAASVCLDCRSCTIKCPPCVLLPP
jgi:hypothetical protein